MTSKAGFALEVAAQQAARPMVLKKFALKLCSKVRPTFPLIGEVCGKFKWRYIQDEQIRVQLEASVFNLRALAKADRESLIEDELEKVRILMQATSRRHVCLNSDAGRVAMAALPSLGVRVSSRTLNCAVLEK